MPACNSEIGSTAAGSRNRCLWVASREIRQNGAPQHYRMRLPSSPRHDGVMGVHETIDLRLSRRGIGPRKISAELDLLSICLRWPPTEERCNTLRGKDLGTLDWSRFMRLLHHHQGHAFASEAFREAGVQPPDAVAEILVHRSRQTALRGLRLAAETCRLATRLKGEGISPLFVKGTPLAVLAYGSIILKHSLDIDLLVEPQQVGPVYDLLVAEGYLLCEPRGMRRSQLDRFVTIGKECALYDRRRGVLVELHWRLTDNPRLLGGVSACSPRRTVFVEGAGRLPTLTDPDLFAYLCVHGTAHGWWRLKWLADVNALLAGRPALEIENLHRSAVERGAGRASSVALLLCHDLFELELDHDFERRLRSSRATRLLIAIALRAVAGRDGDRPVSRPVMRALVECSHLLIGEGWSFLARELSRRWTGAAEQLAVPLPGFLHVLYVIIRPPLWLLRRMRELRSPSR